MMNCPRMFQNCNRDLLIAVNVLIMLFGICMFSYAIADMKVLVDYSEEAAGASQGNVTIIVASILLVLLSLFGCVGTVRKCEKMLYMYIMFIMVFLLMHAIITIFGAMQRFVFRNRVMELMREDFYRNVTGVDKMKHGQLWDKLQTHFECCGLNSPEDYAALGRPISMSCCHSAPLARTEVAKENMHRSCIESKSYYMHGCEEEVLAVLNSDDRRHLKVSAIAVWLETMVMLLAMLVINEIKDKDNIMYWVKY